MRSTPSERLSISLVTPNYNGDAFLERTFQSVAQQKLDGLEYIFVDGASTDRSMQIADDFQGLISTTICEPDNGHADALNKGFHASSGDIMGWINSDDVLLPGCLETVRRVFETFPEIEWITGRASTMNERGELTDVRPARPWSRRRFLGGDHLWIQQESTFWRRGLWDRAGGGLDTRFNVANDFELWARFFRYANLYSVDKMLGGFRVRDGQRSTEHRAQYFSEVDQVLRRELHQLPSETRVAFGDTLPNGPATLSAAELRALELRLSLDDPAIVTTHSLRTGQLKSDPAHEARFEDYADEGEDHGNPIRDWMRTIGRNWRLLLGLGLAGAILVLVAALVPTQASTLLSGSLIGLCLISIGVLAIKVRRVVKRLERSVERALGGRARAELRNQILEAQIEELHHAVSKPKE